MAQALSLRTPFGPNVRIALVTGVSLALLGAVTIVLPLQRLSAVPVHETTAVQTFPKFKPRPVAAAETPAEDSHDQLIAMTFDILQALSKEPISAGDQTFVISQPAAATGSSETTSVVAEAPATAPKTRVVKTTAITIKPVTPLAVTPPAPVVETTAVASELDVNQTIAAAEMAEVAAEPAPEPKAAPKVATVDPSIRIVAGEGVNVRSGPGKSRDKLFALPGGAEVTIGANERGWLEITDAEGRTGWVYKDYLLTP